MAGVHHTRWFRAAMAKGVPATRPVYEAGAVVAADADPFTSCNQEAESHAP